MGFAGALLTAFMFAFVFIAIGYIGALEQFKAEAFERGLMVECLGEIGYHWECN